MKKSLALLTLCTAFGATAALAGEVMHDTSKSSPSMVTPCFADREWQLDLFGAYAFSSSSQDGLFGDHAWGGGLGVNYFFTRYLGLGVEGMLLDQRDGGDALGQAALNVIVRFPIDGSCLAPYVFIGGGAVFNAEDIDREDFDRDDDGSDDALWEAHVGIGVEYRFNPRLGVFVDGRFTVVDKNDNNFATVRTGIRFAF